MASVGEDLRALLLASTAVTAQVVGRVFPQKMPQGVALPAIRYAVVDDVPVNSVEGTGVTARARVQVDVFAKKYLDAQGLADAVVGAVGAGGLLLDRRDGYEDETELHRVSMDFSMWHGG